MDNQNQVRAQNGEASTSDESLLAELDRLEVIEADELQEGVAFHAFRFC
ncbi:MAG: hypothetical protein JWO79_2638 [Actinomycetia bacterium]|nr:hypothetical protein [Actinomycetes bacterium]